MMRLPQRLPSLQGLRGRATRVIVIALLIAMSVFELGSLSISALFLLRDAPAAAHYGIVIDFGPDERPIVAAPGEAATAAGLTAGARIVAINGSRLSPTATAYDAASHMSKAGRVAVLDTADDAGRVSRHFVARRSEQTTAVDASALPRPVGRVLALGTQAIVIVLLLAMALLLFRERPADPEAMLLALAFLLLSDSFSNNAWLTRFGIPTGTVKFAGEATLIIGWWALLVGLSAFPDGRFVSRWSRIAIFAPTSYAAFNLVTNFMTWRYPLLDMALDPPISMLCAGSLFIRYRRTAPGIERQQIKWAALGAAAMLLTTLLGFAIELPRIKAFLGPGGHAVAMRVHDLVITLAFPAGLLVSLLRYRLYDVDRVITRSAAYTVLTAALIAIFACTEKVVELLGEEQFGHSLGALAGGLGAAAAALMIAPLHHRIMHWAEHCFRSNLVHFRHAVPPLLGHLRETATPVLIADALLRHCRHAFECHHGAIVFGRRVIASYGIDRRQVRDWLADRADPHHAAIEIERHGSPFPLRVPLAADGESPVGWLLVGSRPDGDYYDRDERALLVEISEPAARALTVARVRQREKAAIRRAISFIETDIARINKVLAALDPNAR